MTDTQPNERAMSIRGIPEDVYERLRQQAARHRQSMEAEARQLLAAGTARPDPIDEPNLGELIRNRFADSGGIADLDLPSRSEPVRWAEFGA